MVAAAMLAGFYVLRADLARRGIATARSGLAEAFVALPCLAGIVGAKVYHILQTPRDLFADPLGQILSPYGFAWFGGLVAGAAAFVWLARKNSIRLLGALDAGSAAAALGYGIGRIGCLLSGDGDYGVPTSLPWGMSFPNGIVPTTERVHPTPIYEFLAACLIAGWLWRLGRRQLHHGIGEPPSSVPPASFAEGRPLLPQGSVFAFYLVLTGIARFLVEFIRINPRSLLGLTNAQVASLASLVVGVGLYWRIQNRPHRTLKP